jgi:type 2 lantibiotic biosynthesis protein LanM
VKQLLAAPPRGAALAGALEPLARRSARLLTDATAPLRGCLDPGLVHERFTADLADRLSGIAGRVLVLELNVRRVRGRLAGDTPAERFADFVRQLRGESGLSWLAERYPALDRTLRLTAERAVDAGVELLSRHAADRHRIADLLDADPGPLTGFTATGDRHLGSRAVSVLSFATGARLVYRPRPVEAHLHFNDAVRWLNGRAPELRLRTLGLLAGDGYGWAEYAHPAPCANPAQVTRFYTRTGALLALLYALDATDMHYENLIACADQPVLVDVETLFQPVLPAAVPHDPALTALLESVQRTALLPKTVVGDQGALDVSGLGGDKDAVRPYSAARWQDAGTDTMRLVRGAARFAGAANRPRLDGVDADPAAYAGALVSGFRRAYDAIAAGRAEFPVRNFARDRVRVLLRPTRVYGELLTESTHPDVAATEGNRDEVFDVLRRMSAGDPVRTAAVPYEVGDLRAGDIPCFTTRADSREVWSGGDLLPWPLERSGIEAVEHKLARLSPQDRERQEWIIRASLATRTGGSPHDPDTLPPTPREPMVPRPELLLSAARDIADHLCAIACRAGGVNWLTLEAVDADRWAVMPSGAGLATGYLGIALFLAQAGQVTGAGRHAETARQALAPVPRLLESLAADESLRQAVGCGGFGGLGGIAYALAELGLLLDDDEVASWVEPAVGLAASVLTDRTPLDVHDGVAGCLATMLAVRRSTGLAAADRLARTCADLLRTAAPLAELPPGFAFGAAGVGWALSKYAPSPTGADLLVRAARSARGQSWCTGEPGVRLALADALPDALTEHPAATLEHPALRDRPTATLGDRPAAFGGHGLCHGELGRLETLAGCGGPPSAQRAVRRRTGYLLAALDRYGPRCGTPGRVATPGLLDGLAGIGHGLLRLAVPEKIASVLLLRTAHEKEEQ